MLYATVRQSLLFVAPPGDDKFDRIDSAVIFIVAAT
jgi:hypothetical protein